MKKIILGVVVSLLAAGTNAQFHPRSNEAVFQMKYSFDDQWSLFEKDVEKNIYNLARSKEVDEKGRVVWVQTDRVLDHQVAYEVVRLGTWNRLVIACRSEGKEAVAKLKKLWNDEFVDKWGGRNGREVIPLLLLEIKGDSKKVFECRHDSLKFVQFIMNEDLEKLFDEVSNLLEKGVVPSSLPNASQGNWRIRAGKSDEILIDKREVLSVSSSYKTEGKEVLHGYSFNWVGDSNLIDLRYYNHGELVFYRNVEQ